MVSGMFGIKNGVVGHGGTAGDKRIMGAERDFKSQDDTNNLFNIFRKRGLYTASISSFPERHSAWWFNSGFNEMHNVGFSGMESGETVLPVALDWMNRKGAGDNWFLHIHLWDPHTPYRAPASFGNPFADQAFAGWITEDDFKRHLEMPGPHSLWELSMYDDKTNPNFPRMPGKVTEYKDLRRIMDGYDTGILYADYLVGKVFERMKELGIYDDCAIMVTSDHGETMGELGVYCEHGSADEATCRIPMIIKWPRGEAGKTDDAFHYNLDLVPTMAELLNVEAYKKWDGKSYASTVLRGEAAGRDSVVISQMAHVCQRAARFGDWIYIRSYHDGYHLFDREMLFNLREDPHEQYDVKDRYPEICAQGAKIILDWVDEAMLSSGYPLDPLWTVILENGPYHTWRHLPAYLERLEATGRSGAAAALRQRYPALGS
jgi:arylsulfatase A-like enzyme